MSMHLEGPWLSLNGKRRGKKKFKSAEQKRAYEMLTEDWKKIKQSHGAELEEKRQARAMKAEPLSYSLSAPPGRNTTNHIPSRNTGDGIASSKTVPQYTGSEMIGVTILHKSCLQPVFNEQEAKDAASMRR